MVGDTFRIAAFCNAYNLFRSLKRLLLYYLEISDDVDCCLRSDEGELVELFGLKELIGDLDDALFAVKLAGKVDTDGDLALQAFEVEKIKCLIYVFSRDVVQYGTVFQCANY